MLVCMRTTLELNDTLLRQARKRAADRGMRLRDVIEAALRLYLGGGPVKKGYRLQWRTERGKLQPGVDLQDRDALLDLMEGRR